MSKLGSLLIFVGLASIVLSFIDYELSYLMWIENWGTGIGWAIRVGLVVLGLILMAGGKGCCQEKKK